MAALPNPAEEMCYAGGVFCARALRGAEQRGQARSDLNFCG
jgi:hypothetical protein